MQKHWDREKRLRTRSVAGTLALGERIAEMLRPWPRVVLLRGEVGAGKTTLVRGIAAALGASEDDVTSPTFSLIQEYSGTGVRIVHLDLYRLDTEEQLAVLGLGEYLDAQDVLLLAEWGERFASLQDVATTEILIGSGEDGDERSFLVRWNTSLA